MIRLTQSEGPVLQPPRPELLANWIHLANRVAPSGGNARPWKISTFNNRSGVVSLGIDPGYVDQRSPMDLDGASSVVGLGTLAKTLEQLAGQEGYETHCLTSQNPGSLWDGLVHLAFQKGITPTAEFDEAIIKRRHTYRRPLQRIPLDPAIKFRFTSLLGKYSCIDFFEHTQRRDELLPLLLKLESVRWTNSNFLDGLFAEINFHPHKIEADPGIWIGDLGLSAADKILFKLLNRSRSFRQILRPALAKMAPQKSIAHLIRNSGGLFFLQAKDDRFESLFQVGLCFQNMWLVATALGLGFQPVSPTLIAYNYWQTKDESFFSTKDIELISDISSRLRDQFQLDTGRYCLGFRVGHY